MNIMAGMFNTIAAAQVAAEDARQVARQAKVEPPEELEEEEGEEEDVCAECGEEFDVYRQGLTPRRCLECGTLEEVPR